MPFTPAHPALILPLIKRTRLSALGLVVGSVAPDFEYFFKMKVNSTHSHTLAGLFYFDVPVAFLLSWLFLRFVRTNLVSNLPPFLQARSRPLLTIDARNIIIAGSVTFAISALIGSISHLFWDGFTHNNTFFVRHLGFYRGSYIPYDGVKYPLWYALQHISSALGLLIVMWYIFRLPVTDGPVHRPLAAYWLVVVCSTIVIAGLRFAVWPQDLKEGNIIVSIITGSCGGLIIGGLINFNNRVYQGN